jgi:hypothetical protein
MSETEKTVNMTTITLDVPEHVARRLDAERERLPEILEQALQMLPPERGKVTSQLPSNIAFIEMLEFLSQRPSPEEVRRFKISPKAQERLTALLEKNSEEGLTTAENSELDWYERVHDIMTWLKAQS